MYIDFIPMFIKSWNKLYPEVDVKVILINDSVPEKFEEYKDNIICFPALEGISTAFISQYIRLLYPALLTEYENGIVISDIDIIPMNKHYFTKNIEDLDTNRFISYRNFLAGNQIAMCYNVATASTWSEVFSINSIEDIVNNIKTTYSKISYNASKLKGWFTDQQYLYSSVTGWSEYKERFVCLKDRNTGFRRLDRGTFNMKEKLITFIKSGIFSDYHCYRPYEKYKKINDKIVQLL